MLVSPPTATSQPGWLPWVAATVFSVLGSGGLAALLRWYTDRDAARTEPTKIIVDAAQGAVVVQSGVLADLRHELSDTQERLETASAEITQLRSQMAEITQLRAQVRVLEDSNRSLKADNDRLRSRVKHLEDLNPDIP